MVEEVAVSPSYMPGTTGQDMVHHIRGLRDIQLLKSYFLLVWSEWDYPFFRALVEMRGIIREEFCGIAMWQDREDPTKRLDHVLSQLDRGLEYLRQCDPQNLEDHVTDVRFKYEQLKEVLAEKDKEAVKTLSSTPLNLILSMKMLMIVCRISHDRRLCPAPSLPVISHLHPLVHPCSSIVPPSIAW